MLKRGREEKSLTLAAATEPGKRARVQTAKQSALLQLPTVCLALLFSFLDIADNFVSLRRTCREFNRIAQMPTSFPPCLDTRNFVSMDVAHGRYGAPGQDRRFLFTRLPKQYSPTKLIVFEGRSTDGVFQHICALSPAKLEDIAFWGTGRVMSEANQSILQSFLVQAAHAPVKHFRSNCLRNVTLTILINFLNSKECTWELETFELTNLINTLGEETRHRLLTARPLATLRKADIYPVTLEEQLFKQLPHFFPLLQHLRLGHTNMHGSQLDTLLGGLKHLKTLQLVSRGHLHDFDMEESILAVDPAHFSSLETFRIMNHYQSEFSWRTLAHLSTGPHLRTLAIHQADSRFIDRYEDEKAASEGAARDAKLIEQCKPGITELCLYGSIDGLLEGITTHLPQLGQSLVTLTTEGRLRNPDLILANLCKHFQGLRSLHIDVETSDEHIEQISNLTNLELLSIGQEEIADTEGALTLGCLSAFLRMTRLKHLYLNQQSFSHVPELVAQLVSRGIKVMSQ